MTQYKFLQSYKSILCLNGTLPGQGFFKTKLPIIATDGAVNKLINMRIKPNSVIGDLDSLDLELPQDIEVIQVLDQNKSDFQKALDLIEDRNLLPCIVTGINGGYLDHILNNINIIVEKNCNFYAPPILGYVFKAPYLFNGRFPIATKLSLFGMSKARVNTKGLKWNLDNMLLEFPGTNSALNRTEESNIVIEVIEGALLLLIYTENIEDQGKNSN